jgi:hypothetical protein
MPKDRQDGRRWPAPLGDRVARDADASQLAEAVTVLWREIHDTLHPIIGHRGVAALYTRSLQQTTAAHPWLAPAQQGALDAVEPAALKDVLVRQTPAEAAAGALAMFGAFRALLASLVGASLTDRLLHPVWTHSPGDMPAQDTSP